MNILKCLGISILGTILLASLLTIIYNFTVEADIPKIIKVNLVLTLFNGILLKCIFLIIYI